MLYNATLVGYAYINPLDLYNGTNTIPTEFHYQPADPGNQAAEALLTAYLETTGNISIRVQGYGESSPYGSLEAALDPIYLDTSFPGLGQPLIETIDIYLDIIGAFVRSEPNPADICHSCILSKRSQLHFQCQQQPADVHHDSYGQGDGEPARHPVRQLRFDSSW